MEHRYLSRRLASRPRLCRSFSELRRQTGVDDNGKFSYHISKLIPHFVRQTDDGYRLSGAGKRIARTVIAVSGADEAMLRDALEALGVRDD
mgnify:CR=1 FL=1